MLRVGLVLGAGGLTGTAFHAGVLAALVEEVGWDARTAEVLVGTSAGSTAAALMRAGFPPADYVRRITGSPLSAEGDRVLGGVPRLSQPPPRPRGSLAPAAPALLRRAVRRPWTVRPLVAAAALLPAGTVEVDPVGATLRPLFEGWPDRPLWICAVSLRDGRRAVFGRDPVPGTAEVSVADAVMASCAIPSYYRPVDIAGERYVDGGMHSVHNLDLMAGLGLDLVVVSAPMSTSDWAASDAGNAARVPVRAQVEHEARQVRRAGTPVLVISPDASIRHVLGVRSMDVGRRRPVALRTRDAVSGHLSGDRTGLVDLLRRSGSR